MLSLGDLAIEVECQPLENWKLSYPDRNVVTCGELGRVAMYDSVSSEKTLELKTSEFFASALTVSHDGSKIAVGNVNGGLFIFNRDREYKMGRYQLHHKQIRALTFTEDSAKLISACDDQTIKVFDIESEQPQAELTGHKLGVTSVDTHPTDNKLIISSSLDKTVRLWDIRSKHMCGSIPYHSSAVWAARFNSNGKFVASGGESGILAIHSIK